MPNPEKHRERGTQVSGAYRQLAMDNLFGPSPSAQLVGVDEENLRNRAGVFPPPIRYRRYTAWLLFIPQLHPIIFSLPRQHKDSAIWRIPFRYRYFSVCRMFLFDVSIAVQSGGGCFHTSRKHQDRRLTMTKEAFFNLGILILVLCMITWMFFWN